MDMSTTRVLTLHDHRARREHRLRRALALQAPDPSRERLAGRLAALLTRMGGDLAALVWLDELLPGVPRSHVVVDLLHDSPRRAFSRADLDASWERGMPGIVDRVDRSRGIATAVAALGSDGRRAWFVVVEGPRSRPPFDVGLLDEFAFGSGEVAGVLLHPSVGLAPATWPGLVEAPPGEDDEGRDRRRVRWMVLRFVAALAADEFAPEPDELRERVTHLRAVVAERADDLEAPLWRRILFAAHEEDLGALRDAVAALGERAAEAGDLEHGRAALEAAYRACVALGDESGAAGVARALGRLHRNAGRWDESEAWYGWALDLARLGDDLVTEAIALDGWANTLRVKGAFPAARRRLADALDVAGRSGSGLALGSVHQSLLALEALAGNTAAALEHGWTAVEAYDTRRDQLRALVAVAGILLEQEEAMLAERAYGVALQHGEEPYFRLFALDGWAHAAALRGDRATYEARSARVDEADWRPGGPDFEGQVYLYRGRAWARLGEPGRAREWFLRALALAEERRLSQTLFAAQEGLDRLASVPPVRTGRTVAAPLDAAASRSMSVRIDAVDRRLAAVAE